MNATSKQNGALKRPERIRFQLELSQAVMDKLDALVHDTESSSRAEVIRRALGFYGLLVEQANLGKRLEIVDDSGARQTLVIV